MPAAVLALLCALTPQAAPQDPPVTVPEQTEWTATSTNLDVTRFLAALEQQPHGARLRRATFGHTVQGRPLEAVYASLAPADPARLRALVIANIHGGEVEGKEAVQVLLREIAMGEHTDLLQAIDLVFVPVFNADGNDEIDPGNRVDQNGPDRGVGRRHNAQDLDLNRDFVKAVAPETRALLRLFAEVDPHLFMDLHTTNGSHHGYHLTYSPSLSPNLTPAFTAFHHDAFMPAVRARMLDRHGLRIFDYGNFTRGERQGTWATFSAEPRLVFNYAGLRHCVSILSEAYSYLPLRQRIDVTRAFVLECLGELQARRDEVLALRAESIRTARARELPFRFDTVLAPAVDGELLVGSVTRQEVPGLGTRLVADAAFEKMAAKVAVRFTARRELAMPAGWVVAGDWALVAQLLRLHGIEVCSLTRPWRAPVEELRIESLSRQRAPYEGRRIVRLGGELRVGERELPAGSLVIRADQALGRLAAQLLEGQSDDGLATWGFFDAALTRAEDRTDDGLCYPVVRLAALPPAEATAPVSDDPTVFPSLVPYTPVPTDGRPTLSLRIELAAPGTRKRTRGWESEPVWEGRVLRWHAGATVLASPQELEEFLTRSAGKAALVIHPDPGLVHREILDVAETALRLGIPSVHLRR